MTNRRDVLTSNPGIFSMKVELTDCSASWGHGWNQSMAVQFTRAGNFLARVRSVKPTGEKHRTTWKWQTVSDFSGAWKRSRLRYTLEAADLKLPPDPLDEEAPAIVSAVDKAQPPQLHPHRRYDHIHLFVTEQVRNVPWQKKREQTQFVCQCCLFIYSPSTFNWLAPLYKKCAFDRNQRTVV